MPALAPRLIVALALTLPAIAGSAWQLQTRKEYEHLPFFRELKVEPAEIENEVTDEQGGKHRAFAYAIPCTAGNKARATLTLRKRHGAKAARVDNFGICLDLSEEARTQAGAAERLRIYRTWLSSLIQLPVDMDALIGPLMQAEASQTAYKRNFHKNGCTGYVSVETDGKESTIFVTY